MKEFGKVQCQKQNIQKMRNWKETWKCDKGHSRKKKSCLTGWTMAKDCKLPQSEKQWHINFPQLRSGVFKDLPTMIK